MCSSKTNTSEPKISGRPVLQPNRNRVPSLDRQASLNKAPKKAPGLASPLVSPKPILIPSPRPPAAKRGNKDSAESGDNKALTPRSLTKPVSSVKKPKKSSGVFVAEATPGSIAAARREQVAVTQERRKLRIAHYGRTKSTKYEGKVDKALDSPTENFVEREQRRCSYITANSDPIYVAYHDEEWGVPVHDDKLLFELLVLTGAQVGSDWTSVLKKREKFRDVFSGFNAEAVAKYNEKKIASISTDLSIELGLIRRAVDNANRIIEIKKGFRSFAEYLWGFVNHKSISTQYKLCQRIPVKTSKSEGISKDMVRRGFRFVGPTTIHSFMQAAGLTNDHLITCPRHLQCSGSVKIAAF